MQTVHRVEMAELPAVLTLFRLVKKELNKQRNDQWRWLYPTRSTHKADVRNGSMYGLKDNDGFIAIITLDEIQSEPYAELPWRDRTGTPCCLHRLAVHPERRGAGLGKRLLHFAETLAKEKGYTSIRLDVYPLSVEAVGLYEKNGYERIGETRYPLRKHSFIAMEKSLR